MELEFTDKYKLGIKDIDEQHERWIRMYNELYKTLNGSKSQIDSEHIIQILKKMYDYTSYHFKYEEEFMNRIGYPGLSDHRRNHKSMDEEIYRYYRMALNKEFIALGAILRIMRGWILDHILEEDSGYLSYYLEYEKGEKIPSA